MLFTARPTCLLLASAIVAFSLVSAEAIAAKCSRQIQMPGLEPGATVIFVDGLVGRSLMVDGQLVTEGLDDIDPDNIHSIEVTCWNPTTGEFHSQVGVPAILILTKGLVESTRAPIEGLLRAQKAYFSKFSRYAQNLDDLVGFGLPEDVMLEFSATSAGWSAATPGDDVAYRCVVFSGDAAQELAVMNEHEVVCQAEGAKASRLMREMFEGPAA